MRSAMKLYGTMTVWNSLIEHESWVIRESGKKKIQVSEMKFLKPVDGAEVIRQRSKRTYFVSEWKTGWHNT